MRVRVSVSLRVFLWVSMCVPAGIVCTCVCLGSVAVFARACMCACLIVTSDVKSFVCSVVCRCVLLYMRLLVARVLETLRVLTRMLRCGVFCVVCG